jgi:hypothetical protein
MAAKVVVSVNTTGVRMFECVQEEELRDKTANILGIVRGLGLDFRPATEESFSSEDGLLYCFVHKAGNLNVYRYGNDGKVLEDDAGALDWLWERVRRLVEVMMYDHRTFEARFWRQGDHISFVDFVTH